MVRIIVSVVAGLVTAFAMVLLIAMAGHLAFPLPEDLDLRNPEAIAQARPSIPLAAKLIVIFAWFAGAAAGGVVARRIRETWWSAWLIAAIVTCAAVVTVMMIPLPAWMQIAAVAAPLLGGLVAAHLLGPRGGRRESADAEI